MQEIIIKENDAGQRLDKMLAKYLNLAPKSFLYKMLRKKNITLNKKKADGSERLFVGDFVQLFLSDETIEKFTKKKQIPKDRKALPIIYEDDHIVLINKPSGMLSQKAQKDDLSAVELLQAHLLLNGSLTEADLKGFSPSICNRLDRNTSGILIAGKSLIGLQTMAEVLKSRALSKYYLCIVSGEIKETSFIQGYLTKEKEKNRVRITTKPIGEDSVRIETQYQPLSSNGEATLLQVKLITGRTHQIRAHFSSIGHPIIGDFKYGDSKINVLYQKKYKIKSQLLHAYQLKMPEISGALSYLSKKEFTAPYPKHFAEVIKGEHLHLM